MPVTTAKTRIRTPEVMTWPKTGSAMNEVPRHRAKGTRMKPFSVVSLNSMTARKSMIASTKKAISVTTQERAISMISLKFQNTSGKPERRWICDVFSARNGLERRAQPEVLLHIYTLKPTEPLSNVVCCQFLHFGNLVAQHPTSEHDIGHHSHSKFPEAVDLA